MRVLRFIVDGETIAQDPDCDFGGLFPNTTEEVEAEFTFSSDWKSRIKVASFWSVMGKEYAPQVINEDKSCTIPKEALGKVAFKIQIIGKRPHGSIVKTNMLTVYQSGQKR